MCTCLAKQLRPHVSTGLCEEGRSSFRCDCVSDSESIVLSWPRICQACCALGSLGLWMHFNCLSGWSTLPFVSHSNCTMRPGKPHPVLRVHFCGKRSLMSVLSLCNFRRFTSKETGIHKVGSRFWNHCNAFDSIALGFHLGTAVLMVVYLNKLAFYTRSMGFEHGTSFTHWGNRCHCQTASNPKLPSHLTLWSLMYGINI